MIRRTTAPRRAGFSLIELLIVITIISVLAGMLLVAVQGARRSAKRAQVATEIDQLSIACTNFKNEFKLYPPSSFTIPTAPSASDPNFTFLARMFPRWASNAVSAGSITPALAVPASGANLDANQSLVYFLAGPSGTGWHPAQPTAPSGTTKKGPYFEFQQNRLDSATNRYVDFYGTPYLYFASGPNGYPTTNTASLNGTPYYALQIGATTKYVNPEGIQIISAGYDKTPGNTTAANANWSPGSGVYAPGSVGGDDQGNFNNGAVLGANPQ